MKRSGWREAAGGAGARAAVQPDTVPLGASDGTLPPRPPGPKALQLGMAVAAEDVLRVKFFVQRSPMFFLRERSYDLLC